MRRKRNQGRYAMLEPDAGQPSRPVLRRGVESHPDSLAGEWSLSSRSRLASRPRAAAEASGATQSSQTATFAVRGVHGGPVDGVRH